MYQIKDIIQDIEENKHITRREDTTLNKFLIGCIFQRKIKKNQNPKAW